MPLFGTPFVMQTCTESCHMTSSIASTVRLVTEMTLSVDAKELRKQVTTRDRVFKKMQYI